MSGLTYNANTIPITEIFRATSGGTVFSANLASETDFDFFTDTAEVNDAIYFGASPTNWARFSDIHLNIGTAFEASSYEIVWEYFAVITSKAPLSGVPFANNTWQEVKRADDETQQFSQTGQVSFKHGMNLGMTRSTVNGVAQHWIRARIKSLTGQTSKASNTTDLITASDGILTIGSDYTEANPCTLEDIYQFLNTNYPHLECWRSNSGSFYDLTMVNLYATSGWLIAKRQAFEVSNSATGFESANLLRNVIMGEKVDENTGIDGAVLFCYGGSNQASKLNLSSNNKFYNSSIIGDTGYSSLYGEYIDCYFEMKPRSHPMGVVRNCKLRATGTWIYSSGWWGEFVGNQMLIDSSNMGYFYNADVFIDRLRWAFVSGSGRYFIYLYQNNSRTLFHFRNSTPKLPSQFDPNYLIRSESFVVDPLANVFFHNSGADTYTDLTDEFLNGPSAPVHGEVGDAYYFAKAGTGGIMTIRFDIKTSLASNDYEYIWEYYSTQTSDWRELDFWDTSYNFTVDDGKLMMSAQEADYSVININGINSRWVRMRIVTKGTGTPSIDKIDWSHFRMSCYSKWKILEDYTANFKIVDEDGQAIEGANIKVMLGSDVETDENTDSDGKIPEQAYPYKDVYFDPYNGTSVQGSGRVSGNLFFPITEDIKGERNIVISKAGYETYKTEMMIDKESYIEITLKKAIQVMTSNKGPAIKAVPENVGKDRDILIMP